MRARWPRSSAWKCRAIPSRSATGSSVATSTASSAWASRRWPPRSACCPARRRRRSNANGSWSAITRSVMISISRSICRPWAPTRNSASVSPCAWRTAWSGRVGFPAACSRGSLPEKRDLDARELAIHVVLCLGILGALHQAWIEMWGEQLQKVVHVGAQQHAAAVTHPGGVHGKEMRAVAYLEVGILFTIDGEIGEDSHAKSLAHVFLDDVRVPGRE